MTTAEAGKVYANIGVYILTAGVLTSVLKLDEFAKTPKALVVAFSFISLLLIYYGLYLQANATERKE